MLSKTHTIVAPQREPVFRSASAFMRVKLVRKFANAINGIDLSRVGVGDVLELSAHQAAILIGEGWGEAAPDVPGELVDVESSRADAPQPE
jgi:hypothetical protein